MNRDTADDESKLELAFVGDLSDHEADLTEKLLGIPVGGECTIYFDSPGGSPYSAMSLMSLMMLRGVRATGIVTGECSSACLWPFAACRRRLVTPYSVLLFHPMKWQSDEHVHLAEAAEWARHFAALETDMDQLLAEMLGIDAELLKSWAHPGRYLSGAEIAEAGLAEIIELRSMASFPKNGATRPSKQTRRKVSSGS